MNKEAQIINDGKEIVSIDPDTITTRGHIYLYPNDPKETRKDFMRCFLSYHPQAFRLVIFHPYEIIKKACNLGFELGGSYVQVYIPEIIEDVDSVYFGRQNLNVIFKHEKSEVFGATVEFGYESLDVDFYPDQKLNKVPEVLVYFYEDTLIKCQTFRCEMEDNRQSIYIVDPLPSDIEIFSTHHYVPCLTFTEGNKDTPISQIQSTDIILVPKDLVERLDYKMKGKYIILPPNVSFEPKEDGVGQLVFADYELQIRLPITDTEILNILTLEKYKQNIIADLNGLKDIDRFQSIQPTKNGFILPHLLSRFDSYYDKLNNGIEYLLGHNGKFGFGYEDFKNLIIDQGHEPQPIIKCKQKEEERGILYELNGLEYEGDDLEYYGLETIKKYGCIINTLLFIELGEEIYYFQVHIIREKE